MYSIPVTAEHLSLQDTSRETEAREDSFAFAKA